jgi:tetratricopeptide (TPR) repeat protein
MNIQSIRSMLATCVAISASVHAGLRSEPAPAPAPSPRMAPATRDEAFYTETTLSLWRSPQFQRQLTQSYLSETEIEPSLTEKERAQMQKVLALLASEKLDEAYKLAQASRNAAASAVFDFTVANIHFGREEMEQAAAIYEVAVDKFPKFRRAWKNLGLIRFRQGDHAQALPALTRVVELGGADGVTWGLIGIAYANQENHLGAESAFRLANLLDPQTEEWKVNLAKSFLRQRRYQEVIALCDTLLTQNQERADLWLMQANAYLGLEKPLDAARNLELIDRMGAATTASLLLLADIYVNSQNPSLAVECHIRALREHPETGAERALKAAKVLSGQGATADTRRLITAIEATHGPRLTDVERKDLLKLRARIAVAEGADDENVQILEEIVKLDPRDGDALIRLGQHSARTDKQEQAIFYFERAATLEASEADAKVGHAQVLVQQGKLEPALVLLRRAQQIRPRDNVRQYLEQLERVAKSR